MHEHDFQILRKLLDSAASSLASAQSLLNREIKGSRGQDANGRKLRNETSGNERLQPPKKTSESPNIIEGVFDGSQMIGPDGRSYVIPENYASKTKLVEGDVMKLTIQPDGTFVYKQIQQIGRDRLVGVLIRDEQRGEFAVLANGKRYRVLNASVSFFKGQPGDEAVIVVPRGGESAWAALENVVKEPKPHAPVATPKPVIETASKPPVVLSFEKKQGENVASAVSEPLAENKSVKQEKEITLDELEDIDEL